MSGGCFFSKPIWKKKIGRYKKGAKHGIFSDKKRKRKISKSVRSKKRETPDYSKKTTFISALEENKLVIHSLANPLARRQEFRSSVCAKAIATGVPAGLQPTPEPRGFEDCFDSS